MGSEKSKVQTHEEPPKDVTKTPDIARKPKNLEIDPS